MDLISITQTLWRFKKLVIPILILTALTSIYVVKFKPAVYQSTASALLTNPQTSATQTQIQNNPNLKTVNPYNTFVSYGDLDVVANAVMDLLTSPAGANSLAAQGAGNFTLTLSGDFGNPPIIEITSSGSSAQGATQSASIIASAVKSDLYQIQKSEGVNPFFMITAYELVKPVQAEKSSSGMLRSLIAILAVGAILILVVVSIADQLQKRRRASRPDRGESTDGAIPRDLSRDTRMDVTAMRGEPEFANPRVARPAPSNDRSQQQQFDYRHTPSWPER
jgi:capsular polysaccharide biosynthesis protein